MIAFPQLGEGIAIFAWLQWAVCTLCFCGDGPLLFGSTRANPCLFGRRSQKEIENDQKAMVGICEQVRECIGRSEIQEVGYASIVRIPVAEYGAWQVVFGADAQKGEKIVRGT